MKDRMEQMQDRIKNGICLHCGTKPVMEGTADCEECFGEMLFNVTLAEAEDHQY